MNKLIKRIKVNSPSEVLFKIVDRFHKYLSKRRLFTNKYIYDNRSKKSENLFIIIAGFQPYYWEAVFERVLKNQKDFKEPIDICVCIPEGIGDSCNVLRKICKDNDWSYLYIDKDMLSQVQNIAIKLHPYANWIFKIDEDIILSDNYFDKLKKAHIKASNESNYQVGFIGPIININAAVFTKFLSSIGKLDEFQMRFGPIKVNLKNPNDIIHKSPDAAEYIWNQSIPFDEVARHIERVNSNKQSIVPVRYSIGAILFTRSYWERIGYFKVGCYGDMGVEEVQVCGFNNTQFMPTYVAEDIFVGHLGYYSQKKRCKDFFESHQSDIRLNY